MPQRAFPYSSVELPVAGSGSRIRLNLESITGWGVVDLQEDFDCVAFLRAPNELLVAPAGQNDEDNPLGPLTRWEAHASSWEERAPLISVPSIERLVLPDRIRRFKAKWTTNHKQLDLQVGVSTVRALGWNGDTVCSIRVITWGGLLIALSNERYAISVAQTINFSSLP